jgi:hypothetical protein
MNCPRCGAPVDGKKPSCDYCGGPLPAGLVDHESRKKVCTSFIRSVEKDLEGIVTPSIIIVIVLTVLLLPVAYLAAKYLGATTLSAAVLTAVVAFTGLVGAGGLYVYEQRKRFGKVTINQIENFIEGQEMTREEFITIAREVLKEDGPLVQGLDDLYT